MPHPKPSAVPAKKNPRTSLITILPVRHRDSLGSILATATFDHERAVDRLAVAKFRAQQAVEKRGWVEREKQRQKEGKPSVDLDAVT